MATNRKYDHLKKLYDEKDKPKYADGHFLLMFFDDLTVDEIKDICLTEKATHWGLKNPMLWKLLYLGRFPDEGKFEDYKERYLQYRSIEKNTKSYQLCEILVHLNHAQGETWIYQ